MCFGTPFGISHGNRFSFPTGMFWVFNRVFDRLFDRGHNRHFSCSFSCNFPCNFSWRFSRLLYRLLYRQLHRAVHRPVHRHGPRSRTSSGTFSARVIGYGSPAPDARRETLARNTVKTRATSSDVKMVSGETMTETMTLGQKMMKRDTLYPRIALRVAPPGIEPGLS